MKAKRTLAGVIRQKLDAIEQQLEEGFRQEYIVTELAEEGFQTTIQNFRNELYRARKWRAAKVAQGVKTPFKEATPPAKKSESEGFVYGGTPKNTDHLF